MKISQRSEKIAGSIRKSLPEIIQKLLSPDQIGFVTVIAVEVSSDLLIGDVFVRSIGGRGEGYLKMLNSVSSKIAHELLRTLKLQKAIRICFKQDKSIKLVQKLENEFAKNEN